MTASRAAVTPAGVRNGDPSTLEALCERRGPAVLAYCEQVCAPGEAVPAAADAFAQFRAAVASAPAPAELDPEALLLSATRRCAAARAPRAAQPVRGLGRRFGGRGGRSACELVPDLLVARAERRLSMADEQRLDRHLERCTACYSVSRRFASAQHTYGDPPSESVPEPAARAIVAALAEAAPLAVPEPEAAADVAVVDEREGASDEARGAHAPVETRGPDAVVEPQEDEPAPAVVELPEDEPAPAAVEKLADGDRGDGDRGERAQAVHAVGNGSGPPTITVRGHPEDVFELPEMPAEIAARERPGRNPRRPRRHAPPARRHGAGWGLLLPGAVLGAALVAVLALAGVFSSGGKHAVSASSSPAAPPAAAGGTSAAAAPVHRARRHRAPARRHASIRHASTAAHRAHRSTPAATSIASSPAATATPTGAAAPSSAPTPGSTPRSTPPAATTVQAVGAPSSAPPASGGAPSGGGTGFQPGG